MVFLKRLIVLALAHLTFSQTVFNLDCSTCPEACNNDCFGIYQRNLPSMLNYDAMGKKVAKKRRGQTCGCPSPCGLNGFAPYNANGGECDEYPPASTSQGGSRTNVVLRCVPVGQNKDEGLQFEKFHQSKSGNGCSGRPCQFTLMFTNTQSARLCTGTANDQREFRRLPKGQRGVQGLKRDFDDIEILPTDGNSTFPVHMRREFLLENGERAIWISTNMTHQFQPNHPVIDGRGGNTTIVRELFGEEKSEPFRPGRSSLGL